MIKFEKIEFKNFQSYGNSIHSFSFDEGVIRLSGATGQGKSSIVEALYYVLFGKPYRNINLSQLINSINKKELEVTLHFSIQNNKYRIERGMKPNYFRIYENDVLKEITSNTKSYQEILEVDILKFNSSMFDQVCYKSLTKNSTFLTLPKKDKRDIIETLLDVKIYSSMNKVAKDIIDELNKDIKDLDKDISNNEILIKNELENIEKLKLIQKEQQQQTDEQNKEYLLQIETLNSSIEKNELILSKIENIKLKLKKNVNEISIIDSKIDESTKEKLSIESQLQSIKSKIKFLQSTCGDCPKIKDITVNDNVEELLERKKVLNKILEELELERNPLIEKNVKYKEYVLMESSILSEIKMLKIQINNFNKMIENNKSQVIEIDETKIEQYRDHKDALWIRYNSKCDDKKHFTFARSLLSDESIKAFIVKKYLPSINKLLNSNIQKFVGNLILHFDEEFEPVCKSRHKENFTYESFSEGQKRLINLSILFTFIDFCKMKYQYASTNLLILDEVTTGLDVNLQDKFYETLQLISRAEQKCIVIMQHGEINNKHIDRQYNVEIVSGFSKIEKEK